MENTLEKTPLQQGIDILNTYASQAEAWLKDNQLAPIPEFDSLRDKDVYGSNYRAALVFYETIARFKADYFSLRGYFSKLKSETPPRLSKSFDDTLALVAEHLKLVDTYVDMAKQRIKFYDSVSYVLSNMTYGEF